MIAKNLNRIENIDFALGETVLIDKNKGCSSYYAVHRVKRTTGIKKVGHAGTLDPMASGLLIICTGKATKTIETFQDMPKVYTGTFCLGQTTDSFDSETEPSEVTETDYITEAMLDEARNRFIGEISQMPPMYSAVKHKGKALYKYARKGVEIKRNERIVSVYEFDIKTENKPFVDFRIKCSKGTYIRSIANDFGKALGCGAYLYSLRRESIGEYNVRDAFSVDEFTEKFRTDSKGKTEINTDESL